ncbi:hypothetical protein QJQ45_023160 [Haematococcus lacustris]|nr:hypothetical protein QJQ45_023160 [Haematococcus lacustris]
MGKAKPAKHTAAEIKAKEKAALTNMGGGKLGLSDRLGGKAGHAKYMCHICKTAAPSITSMQSCRSEAMYQAQELACTQVWSNGFNVSPYPAYPAAPTQRRPSAEGQGCPAPRPTQKALSALWVTPGYSTPCAGYLGYSAGVVHTGRSALRLVLAHPLPSSHTKLPASRCKPSTTTTTTVPIAGLGVGKALR